MGKNVNVPRLCGILLVAATTLCTPLSFAEKCGSALGPLAGVLKPADKNAVAVEAATLRLNAEVGVGALAFSSDSRRFATASGLSEVLVWDWANHRLLKKLTVPVRDGRNAQIGWLKWESVLFSPANQNLVACTSGYNESPRGVVASIVWDSQSSEPLQELIALTAVCDGIAFTRDGCACFKSYSTEEKRPEPYFTIRHRGYPCGSMRRWINGHKLRRSALTADSSRSAVPMSSFPRAETRRVPHSPGYTSSTL